MASSSAIIAWGAGEDGQLGIGSNEEKEYVCVIKALEREKVRSVVAGSRNSLPICEDGKLFTWGWNQRGTLGHPPETKTENIPSQVKALVNVKIVQRLLEAGTVWLFMIKDEPMPGVFDQLFSGNEYGQCGEEPEGKDNTVRPLRRDIVIPQRCAPKLVVRQVAAGGGTHSVVLTREGHVWTWGQPWPPGDIRQISVPVRVQGLESMRLIAPRSQPIPVQGLSGLTLVDIAAGGWHSNALTDEGEVYG
ncbi:Regulator of chromosome condensation (RCC1) family protein [Quillaja saponaria]|uniref:Regulator of chromosome condensation (RCC1) family protein n=1 Tax=Quillaja saponaria TaxID=32244 RepID=A0AAD7PXZ5_QUISA|nr:Regulator of chromosome condensation (RCC1) family protein [Quillaja saponaria]